MGNRRTPAEQLADMESKKRQIAERIEALSARTKARQRKDDDRRRVLLGSIILADLTSLGPGSTLASYIRDRLPAVMRDGDERLFITLLQGDAS